MVRTKIIPSLEKCFLDDPIDRYPAIGRLSALRNQRVTFQYVFTDDDENAGWGSLDECTLVLGGSLAKYASVRTIENVVNAIPTATAGRKDPDYLRTAPGLYPDLLLPCEYGANRIRLVPGQLRSVLIECDFRADPPDGGEYSIEITLQRDRDRAVLATDVLTLTVIDDFLPEHGMVVTDWLYCDCLADYYRVPVFSDRHFEIIGNYVAAAVANGMNMILTPVFTPPLDTAVGGERTTTQLVRVEKDGDDYRFSYDLFDRFVDLCTRMGMRYFEISHLFTQWGAAHAPKIVATENGVEKRIFGWETDAAGAEYVAFLRAFLSDFVAHLRALGIAERCYFHLSDEPGYEHLENYRAARAAVSDLLDGFPIIDALSDFRLFRDGVVDRPVPASSAIAPFLSADLPHLWTYYCCSQCVGVSNRLLAMPGARTRSLGLQLYKYRVEGFLHWGFNFYNTHLSAGTHLPFADVNGGDWVPGGDAFAVYPANDGTPYESLHLLHFYEALEDVSALRLAERYCPRDALIREIEAIAGSVITFDRCVSDSLVMLAIRDRVNEIIAEKGL